MPIKTLFASGFALAVLLGLLCGCASEAQRQENGASQGRARIVRVEGGAEVASSSGNWFAARSGQELAPGDQARTAGASQIDFNLGTAGGVLTLKPDSLIQFEQLGPVTPDADVLAIVDLRRGRVVGDTLKLPAGKKIVIRTARGAYNIH